MTLAKFHPSYLTEAVDTIQTVLAQQHGVLEALRDAPTGTYADISAYQDVLYCIEQYWQPIEHLFSVDQTAAVRETYNLLAPKVEAFHTHWSQDQGIFAMFTGVSHAGLTPVQQRVLNESKQDFIDSGSALPTKQRQQFAQLEQQLLQLTTKFQENVLDATAAWKYHTDIADLSIPASIRAQARGDDGGYSYGLDTPTYLAIIENCENRALREQIYRAYTTRASATFPIEDNRRYDNAPLIAAIVHNRQLQATLLGYQCYADMATQRRMAKNNATVLAFLHDILDKAQPIAEQEVAQLRTYAQQHPELPIDTLQPWDIAFYLHKLSSDKLNIDHEKLREYFPFDHVLEQMFAFAKHTFAVECTAAAFTEKLWHVDVQQYTVHTNGRKIGYLTIDPYARDAKQPGAWMSGLRSRHRGTLPIASIQCNFAAPVNDAPSLLRYDDVVTLFHEFGHALHHVTTVIDEYRLSGISGVAWDAVEFPSQIIEKFTTDVDVLRGLTKHYITGQQLDERRLHALSQQHLFFKATTLVRQIEFCMFDSVLHTSTSDVDFNIILDKVRQQTNIYGFTYVPQFAQSFAHIFAGGYAAGYYSYLWAEILAADGFAYFMQSAEKQALGTKLIATFFSQGGSADARTLYGDFRGQAFQSAAFFQQFAAQV